MSSPTLGVVSKPVKLRNAPHGGTDTLRIGCTELKAVPHAGLGFQFLRVHVRTTDPGGLQEEVGPKEKNTSDEPTR